MRAAARRPRASLLPRARARAGSGMVGIGGPVREGRRWGTLRAANVAGFAVVTGSSFAMWTLHECCGMYTICLDR